MTVLDTSRVTMMRLWHGYQGAWLSALLALWVLGFWAAGAVHLADILWRDSRFAYGLMVLPTLAYILYDRYGFLLQRPLAAHPFGVLWAAGACSLYLVGQAAHVGVLQHVGITAALQAIMLFWLGPRVIWSLKFEWMFLLALVPFGTAIIGALQMLTARLAIMLLQISGYQLTADGSVITLYGNNFHVAEACAGFQFLATSLFLGVLVARLFFTDMRDRLWVCAFSLMVPIAANAVRVATILALAGVLGVDFAKSVDHVAYGWGVFALVLCAMMTVAFSFGDGDRVRAADMARLSVDMPETLDRVPDPDASAPGSGAIDPGRGLQFGQFGATAVLLLMIALAGLLPSGRAAPTDGQCLLARSQLFAPCSACAMRPAPVAAPYATGPLPESTVQADFRLYDRRLSLRFDAPSGGDLDWTIFDQPVGVGGQTGRVYGPVARTMRRVEGIPVTLRKYRSDSMIAWVGTLYVQGGDVTGDKRTAVLWDAAARLFGSAQGGLLSLSVMASADADLTADDFVGVARRTEWSARIRRLQEAGTACAE